MTENLFGVFREPLPMRVLFRGAGKTGKTELATTLLARIEDPSYVEFVDSNEAGLWSLTMPVRKINNL